MIRYAIYCRVSTEDQARPDRVSLDEQLRQCRQYVVSNGGSVVLEAKDVQTGLSANRPGYQQVLAAARSGSIDAAVVWRFDRWGRDDGEAISTFRELERLGVSVVSVTQPGSDPFLQGLHALLARQSSLDTSIRTKNGLRAHAQRGRWSGAPPLGYRIKRGEDYSTLEPDLETAHLVTRLFNEAATGKYSVAQLADMAEGWGLQSRHRFKISRQIIAKMLRNPSYRGAIVYGRKSGSKFSRPGPRPQDEWIVVENAHPALIDTATWERVQGWLTHHRKEQGTVRHTRFLLTSLVYCGVCDGTPGPQGKAKTWRVYGNGIISPVYQCSKRHMYGLCTLPPVTVLSLEARVKRLVAGTFSLTGELRARAAHYIEEEAAGARTVADKQRADVERAIERHKRERLQLARRLMGNVIAEDLYQQLEAEEVAAIRHLERELEELPAPPAVVDVTGMLEALGSLEWDDLSWEGWRQVLVLLVSRIMIDSRDHFRVEWQPAAEILRNAVANVSRFGSET